MHRFYLLFIWAFFVLSFFACSTNQKKENTSFFRYNESAGITSLDPAFSRTFENIWAVNQLFEGLVELDDHLQVQPGIAKRWEISNEGKQYTFTLRDDVFFHTYKDFNGRKVVAQDFVYSFNRLRDPKTASPGQWVFNHVHEEGFSAPNDSTLVIELKEPFPPFMGILTMKYCSVVPHEMIEKYGIDFRSNPVGTGPFRFNYWVEEEMLAFVKNEDYYLVDSSGIPLPYLNGIGITFNRDLNAVFLEFLKGNYSIIQGTEGEYMQELLDEMGNLRDMYSGEVVLDRSPWLKTDYLGFFMGEKRDRSFPALLNSKVRKAINLGINREVLTQQMLYGLAYPAAGGFIPKGFGSSGAAYNAYSYNPDKSRQLLQELGYSPSNPLKLTLNVTSNQANLGQFIQHQLGQIGIELTVDILESGNLNEQVARGDAMFFKKSWLADYPDEENFMALFYSENKSPAGPNYTHFCDPTYDALYEKALTTEDKRFRTKLYARMDSIVAQFYPVVPLYYGQAVRFRQKEVKGLSKSAVNMLDLRRVQL